LRAILSSFSKDCRLLRLCKCFDSSGQTLADVARCFSVVSDHIEIAAKKIVHFHFFGSVSNGDARATSPLVGRIMSTATLLSFNYSSSSTLECLTLLKILLRDRKGMRLAQVQTLQPLVVCFDRRLFQENLYC
jgi:hypothetical protein